MSIWRFKCKRFPDGTLDKHKACLCTHCGMQTWGTNNWETYAPVINNWASVCLLPDEDNNADNIYSWTGFVIYYAGCPVFWQSKL
jgi:hypothetical protein